MSVFDQLGLPDHALSIDGVEYFGGVGYLKAGLQLCDRITTVSPTYAREIMTPEFGMALDGLLRARAPMVQGIRNGIDDSVWNPATDPGIAQNYTALRIDMRRRNKTALQTRMGLAPNRDRPLFGVVSRLSTTKGPRPAAAGSSGSHRQGRTARAARLRRTGAGIGFRRRRRRGNGLGRVRLRL